MNAVVAVLMLLGTVSAQVSDPRGVLSGIVLDPSDAPVPGARVVLKQGDRDVAVTITSPSGGFRFADSLMGSFDLFVTVAGFEPVRRTIRVGSRARQPIVIKLILARLKEEVTVSEEGWRISIDPGGNADAVSVERSLLDKLPILDNNYLSALSRFLDAGTSGDAGISIIVDGMEMRNAGVTASAIQEIRINNNPYTVEYPRWSRRRIEVITKSSTDRYHGTLNFLFRDHHLNARDALAAQRPQEQRRIFEGSLFGPFLNRKNTSFLLSGAREEEDLVAVVFAQGLGGAIKQNVPTPQYNTVGSLRVSRDLNEKQAMFWQVNFQDRWQNNIGTGGTTLAEAGAQSRFPKSEVNQKWTHRGAPTQRLLISTIRSDPFSATPDGLRQRRPSVPTAQEPMKL